MRTIKDLANEFNISKVTIYSNIKKDNFKGHVFKDLDGTTLVDEVGEEILRDTYFKVDSENISDSVSEKDNSNELKDDEINKSYDILLEQLREKDNQIKSLLGIIENNQKLEATKSLMIENKSSEVSRNPNKGIFTKIFGF